jgi:uncharacterized protein (TIGR02453 family)
MITKPTLKFLADLKKHNTRDWFEANRGRYKAAREEFIALVDAFIAGIAHFEPHVLELEPEDCIFRINRDTRFSKNKEPYKPNLGAFITDRGRKVSRAGYYIHLEAGGSMTAGGLYMPPAPELKAIRRAIQDDAAPLRKILADKKFTEVFGKELPGIRVKTAPRDVAKDDPNLDLLRYQSFEVFRPVPDATVLAPGFAKACVKDFELMSPYVRWLNAALDRHLKSD